MSEQADREKEPDMSAIGAFVQEIGLGMLFLLATLIVALIVIGAATGMLATVFGGFIGIGIGIGILTVFYSLRYR